MRPSRRERRTASSFLIVGALLTGACAQPDPPGVGVSNIAADIVFGVKDVDPSTPANTSTAPITPEQASEFDVLEPTFFAPRSPRPKKDFPRPVAAVEQDCPPAELNEFPDEPAPETVTRLPKEGLYRWKRSGSQEVQKFKTPITGFEERIVRDVEVITDTEERKQFTFRTVQPELGSGLVVLTDWYVDSNPVADREVNWTSPAMRASAGEPERGIVIRRIERQESDGDRIRGGVTSFPAGAGLLIVPLPIRIGEKFVSQATDIQTGRVVRFEGQVRDRERVDACGDVLDGWKVTGRITGDTEEGRTYDVIVAPHLGGIVILEHHAGPLSNGGVADATFTIGQKDPTPVTAKKEG